MIYILKNKAKQLPNNDFGLLFLRIFSKIGNKIIRKSHTSKSISLLETLKNAN